MPATGWGAGPRKPVGRHWGGDRHCWERLAVAKQWILLPREGCKFCAGNPGALDELELSGNVGVEAKEVKPGLRVRRRRVERGLAIEPLAVFTAAPQNPMEPGGRNRVVLGSNEWPHRRVARPRQRGRGWPLIASY